MPTYQKCFSDDELLVSALRKYYAGKEPGAVREDLDEKYGNTWTDAELLDKFEVHVFDGPRVHVIQKSDGARGTVGFIDEPRFYFSFIPDTSSETGLWD
jgi:hypothetical protein